VAQPAFEALCAAVRSSGAVRHFLLGNNLALAGDGPEAEARLAALTSLIAAGQPIETWCAAPRIVEVCRRNVLESCRQDMLLPVMSLSPV
jgi:hypothetical protein